MIDESPQSGGRRKMIGHITKLRKLDDERLRAVRAKTAEAYDEVSGDGVDEL